MLPNILRIDSRDVLKRSYRAVYSISVFNKRLWCLFFRKIHSNLVVFLDVYSFIYSLIFLMNKFLIKNTHCVKKKSVFGVILVRILLTFFHIWTEYGEIQSISPYSVRIRKNARKLRTRKLRIRTLFTQ